MHATPEGLFFASQPRVDIPPRRRCLVELLTLKLESRRTLPPKPVDGSTCTLGLGRKANAALLGDDVEGGGNRKGGFFFTAPRKRYRAARPLEPPKRAARLHDEGREKK